MKSTICLSMATCALITVSLPADTQITITGNYLNKDYSYSIQLKKGLSGTNLSPPAPQHGFGIDLKPSSDGYVWVNAEYDVLMAGSLERAAEQVSKSFAEPNGLRVSEDKPASLSTLPARDIVLSNPTGKNRINYVRLRIAWRTVANEPAIVYTIGLQQHTRSATGEAIFSSIADSFRTVQISN